MRKIKKKEVKDLKNAKIGGDKVVFVEESTKELEIVKSTNKAISELASATKRAALHSKEAVEQTNETLRKVIVKIDDIKSPTVVVPESKPRSYEADVVERDRNRLIKRIVLRPI